LAWLSAYRKECYSCKHERDATIEQSDMSHPARYSKPILDIFAEILIERYPFPLGRPVLHDPFAGTGERLHELCNRPEMLWFYSGTEIEPAFIRAPGIFPGDSRDPLTYPPFRHPTETSQAGWLVVSSPVYANGMADSHFAQDGSRRRNYRKAKAEITGDPGAELHPENMGNYGYRGTSRDGKSRRRAAYWRIADEAVQCWGTASLVLLNVSDFLSGGVVEPHVDDWKALLRRHGWVNQIDVPVGTPRMRDGANADQRVAHEVIVVAQR
jgi:hypothetical protein